MNAIITNDFHNTSVTLRLFGKPDRLGRYWLSAYQVRRARRTLCGHADCACGGKLGQRGAQSVEIDATYGWSLHDVRVTLRPVCTLEHRSIREPQ